MSGASDLVEALDEWSQSPVGQALGEVRDHMRRRAPLLLGIGVLTFVLTFPLTADLVALLIAPERLPDGVRIIITTPIEFLMLQVRLAANAGLVLMLVVLLFDLVRKGSRQHLVEVAPHLQEVRERISLGVLFLSLMSAIVLAVVGLAYATYGLVPLLLDYLTTDAQAVGLSTDWRLMAYVGFLIRLHLAAVVGFQAPLVTMLVLRSGALTREALVGQRRQVWFGCVVVGAFVSPPDPLSLFLVALPVVLLFELGLLADRLFGRAA